MIVSCPRIAITSGEPAGIGIDLCLQLVQADFPCQLIILADAQLIQQRAQQLNIKIVIRYFNADEPAYYQRAGELTLLPINLNTDVIAGQLNSKNSEYVLKILNTAVIGCMKGVFSAMVTAPVHKGIINDAGFAFTGHTEYIAKLTGGVPVMMLATEGLRVALATTHLPLTQVSRAINAESLTQTITIVYQALIQRFHCINPTLLISGLNPHAGENGYLGREEIEIINPVIQQLQQQGMNLIGALPADTLFTEKYLSQADAVLAMYHDQGLPVLKYKGFGQAVNITLGLPIVRTSVDHGTALELAGTGKAQVSSLRYALETALAML